MRELLIPYAPTVLALGAIAFLLLIQLLIADVIGIKKGHRPGTPVEADHSNIHFRATRAHANTNESIAAFVLLVLLGLLSGASPAWLNGLAWTYVLARAAHMSFYYLGWQLPRSVAFAVSLVALFAMVVVGAAAAVA